MLNAQLKAIVLCLSLFAPSPLASQRIQGRVVGGHAITIKELGGYLIALLFKDKFTCAGSLIREQIVITAQHCFLGRIELNQWTAIGGITNLHEHGQQSRVESMMKPIAFRDEDLHMDVAVIKLRKSLSGPDIKPIALCTHNWQKNDLMGLSGWGLIDPTATAPHQTIRTVQVPVIAKKACRSAYAAVNNLTESMFCAGGMSKKDACTYDSGGPLVFHNELCGIVSYGIGCANPKFPGVYTNINYVKPFIQNAIATMMRSQ